MTTLVPKYDQGATGAVNRPFNEKLAESVSVLDFGADPTGVADSTAAFNAAATASNTVYIPDGTYSISNVLFRGGEQFVGESRIGTILQVNTNDTGAFYNDWTTSFVVQGLIENLTITAKAGVTGARGFLQLDKSTYTGYTSFINVETHKDLQISYDGFFIYCLWDNCRDGYRGNAVGGQTHQAIRSEPAAYGQGNQTNLCRVLNSQFYGSTATDGYVFVSYGVQWAFYNSGFESGTSPAIQANGILNTLVQGCWFESIDNANIIICSTSPAPNAQGTRPVWVVGNFVSCTNTNARFVSLAGAAQATITNNSLTGVPAGMVLANTTELYEVYGNIQNSGGGTDLLTNIKAARVNVLLRTNSEAEDTFTNSPYTTNLNILPIGPSGLGAASFTNLSFTSITDTASGIGLATQAVRFDLAGVAQAAYYAMPAKLVAFLQGKTVTLIATGYSSTTAAGETVATVAWDSVVPNATNYTSVSTAGIATPSSTLQTTYITFTVGAAASSLAVGVRTGGGAAAANVDIETMTLVLGKIKPTFTGFN
jgi:hypothetical protein